MREWLKCLAVVAGTFAFAVAAVWCCWTLERHPRVFTGLGVALLAVTAMAVTHAVREM